MDAKSGQGAISATVAEKKRGRPAIYDAEWSAFVLALHREARSKRAKLDVLHRCYAAGALKDEPATWIFDPVAASTHGGGPFVPTVLAELGRFQDRDLIRALAVELDKMAPRPTARQAVAILRGARARLLAGDAKGGG